MLKPKVLGVCSLRPSIIRKQFEVTMAQPQFGEANGVAVQQLASNGDRVDPGGFKLKFCTVCASNQNRYVGRHEKL